MTQANSAAGERPGIWELAFPSILGNLLFTVVGIVQTKFVGEIGTEALAATGAGQRVFFALQAVLMAVSVGTTALVARAWGAGDRVEASRVALASLLLGGAFSAVAMFVGMTFAGPIAGIFGLDPVSQALAADYIFWLSAFNLAFAAIFILGAALRAAGDAWSPLYIGMAVNVINLPLLYVLVFGKFGFPALGSTGAAFAGGLSFVFGTVIMLWLWIAQRFELKYVAQGWWRRARVRALLDVGYPAAIEQLVFQVGFFVFLMLIGNFYGTEAFAAYNIGVNLLMVCMTVGFGFSIAGSTLVGQHLGADDVDGAVRSGWRSLGFAVLSMGSLGFLIMLNAEPLARYFIVDDERTIRYTVQFTQLLGASTPLLAVEFAIGGSLRGAGDTRFPLLATIAGLIGMRCGLAALATWLELPVFWVYASLVGDYLLKGSLLLWRFRSGRWKSVLTLQGPASGADARG
ncbi:MAG: MATE family efflux transporter [Pseudomonadota bacterium]